MAAKEWAHVEMLIDGARVFELMKFCEGKILPKSLNVRPVKHGGQDEETGELIARPSGRVFVMAFAQAHKKFAKKELYAAGRDKDMTAGAIYQAVSTLLAEKALKRVGEDHLALTSNADVEYAIADRRTRDAVRKRKERAKGKASPGKRRKPEGETLADKILTVVRRLQNGTGEGVSTGTIKEQLGGKTNGVSPVITKLVREKLLTRIAHNSYRAAE